VLVSGILFTDRLDAEGLAAFSNFRNVVDEFIAFVDERSPQASLEDDLCRIGARVVEVQADRFYEPGFAESILGHCRGDWILKVDHDEELSAEWFDPRWCQLLDSGHTHFWSPRRWLTARDTFLAAEPWWPDWQMRLFRNAPGQMRFPKRLHENPIISGSAGALSTLAIHHHHLRVASRRKRETKVTKYEMEQPGGALAHYYLYEDYQPPELPVPKPVPFDPDRELLRSDPLGAGEAARLQIQVGAPPSELPASKFFWIDARVHNGTSRAVGWGMPAPVHLSYHWLDGHSCQPIVFEGQRTALFPPVSPGSNAACQMLIMTPPIAGQFILRVTLVQEGVLWLDGIGSPAVADFIVAIRPG